MKKLFKILFLIAFLISGDNLLAQEKGMKMSENEFAGFVNIVKEAQAEKYREQERIKQMVNAEGLTFERFAEIQYAIESPIKQVDATKEELDAHKRIMRQVESLKEKFDSKLQQYIVNNGLSMERYEEIATQLQTDEQLRQRVLNNLENKPVKN